MIGGWIFVCGPSGAGKDSVMASAQHLLGDRDDIVFARRVVTRAAEPGSRQDAMTEHEFVSVLAGGGFCWHWQAHGFHYGIDRHYADMVQDGRLVVVNGSRAHAAVLPSAPEISRVHITAGAADLQARLAHRGRDSSQAIAFRLARNMLFNDLGCDYLIVNDGVLADAGHKLADYLAGRLSVGTNGSASAAC
jgi:ribose 1,5-bisphosphokinase